MDQLSKNVLVFHVEYFLSYSNLHIGHFGGTGDMGHPVYLPSPKA